MNFEWDDNKADHNIQKHGVSFPEASTVFYDTLSVTFLDPDHSDEEDRFIIIGQSNQGRLLFVAHTDRGDRVRIISARPLRPKERRLYAAQ
ncbi:MAG: BrnT family toxin [Burkholderiales bacterium]|nr:BrnT family toxin [Anaerolineae bacterium]